MTAAPIYLAPGVHPGVPAGRYHADRLTEQPTLSAGIAKLLLTRSRKHAWTEHPRLNPNFERVDESKFDLGTAVHSLFLQGEDIAEWIDAADWRTNDAQEARTIARRAGRVPLLLKNKPRVEAMLTAIREQLDQRDDGPPLFAEGGKPEQTLIWTDGGVRCRALVDWLHDDFRTIDDLKTTAVSANPHAWTRTTMWNIGADIQLAFHSRGVKATTGRDPLFRFVVIECQPPYALSAVTLGPAALALANDKIDRALETWKRCLETDTWPAYSRELCHADPPPWMESQWMEQQAIEEPA